MCSKNTGAFEAIKSLLRKNADIYKKNTYGQTILHNVAESGYYSTSVKNQINCLELLIENLKSKREQAENVIGLENQINSRDIIDRTPLYRAIENGN